VRLSSSLSTRCNFSCSAETQQALIFWLPRPLVLYVVATLRPVCLCAIEDRRYGCPDLRREGSGRYNCRYPVAIEVWMLSWWNDRVMLGQGVVLVLLLTVHGHICPIGLSGCCDWRPRGSPSCQRAPHVPQARQKYAKGFGLFDDVMGVQVRRKLPPEAPISPETFLLGSGGMEVDVHASSD
jgi:hypothetical protein